MRVDGERWPSNGIRHPGLHAFAVGQAKICARAGRGAYFFFSVRLINAISGFSDRRANAKYGHL
jgi:hypothetical protein